MEPPLAWSIHFEGINAAVVLFVLGSIIYTTYRAIRHLVILTVDIVKEIKQQNKS